MKKKKAGRPAGPDPVKRFNVTIPEKLHAQAKAKAKGKSFSAVLTELLEAWVK